MSAFLFYWRRALANLLRSLIKKPSRLFLLLMIVVPLVILIVVSIVVPPTGMGEKQPIELLFPILFLICSLLSAVSWAKGCQTGGTFFRMADVNLLFTSPLRPQRILAFGLINQMVTVLASAVFIIYQLPNLMRAFTIGASGIIALVVAYLLLILIGELISMALYIFLSSHPHLRPVLSKVPIVAGVAILLTFVFFLQREGQDFGKAWVAFANFPAWQYLPPAGWLSAAVIALISGRLTETLIYSGLLIALPLGILFWINRAQADYYENVLIATEQKEQTLLAAREGRSMAVPASSFARFKRNQGGIGRGQGAEAFFWRQILVLRRRSRMGPITMSMIMQIVVGFALVIFLRDQPEVLQWIYLPAAMTYLFIAVRFNEWPQELRRSWIYIAPATSGAKLFWATLPGPLKALYDALPYYLILIFAGGIPAPAALAAWLLTGTFASLNVSAGMIIGRIFGKVSNKGFTSMLAMMLEYMLMVPSILAVILGAVSGRYVLLFALGVLFNVLIYWICWLIGRDMLHEHDE